MKERPILFSGEMVRAILAGKKTQTRRVIKPAMECPDLSHESTEYHTMREYPDGSYRAIFDFDGCLNAYSVKCGYGKPGDRLWVRENFAVCNKFGETVRWTDLGRHEPRMVVYAANNEFDYDGRWTPCIHMPRGASRITLEIKDVRVERVQDITGADVFAEGVNSFVHPKADYYERAQVDSFKKLWESINQRRGYGWDVNPWVWVVEFERVTT